MLGPISYLFSMLQSLWYSITTDPGGFFLETLFRVVAVLSAITFHEVAHGYVAYKCGDPTAKMLGRLSLNPLKHLDPIGALFLLIFRFGWAKPVPVNPRNFSNLRRDDFLVSIAGITVNFTLFIISTALFVGLSRWSYQPFVAYILKFLVTFLFINLGLGIFNLIPIPPLDGFHILNDTLLRGRIRLTPQFFRTSQLILIFLMVSGVFNSFLGFAMETVFNGVYHLFLRMTGAA